MSQADERIVMQDAGAYGTVEVPAAPKKKSIKRLVASVRRPVSLEIKILRRVRAESSRRPLRHRRDACSIAWCCDTRSTG